MSILICRIFVQINLNLLEALGENGADAVAIGLNVDSGLGIFDAFVASFSMILVSEVCAQTFLVFIDDGTLPCKLQHI